MQLYPVKACLIIFGIIQITLDLLRIPYSGMCFFVSANNTSIVSSCLFSAYLFHGYIFAVIVSNDSIFLFLLLLTDLIPSSLQPRSRNAFYKIFLSQEENHNAGKHGDKGHGHDRPPGYAGAAVHTQSQPLHHVILSDAVNKYQRIEIIIPGSR